MVNVGDAVSLAGGKPLSFARRSHARLGEDALLSLLGVVEAVVRSAARVAGAALHRRMIVVSTKPAVRKNLNDARPAFADLGAVDALRFHWKDGLEVAASMKNEAQRGLKFEIVSESS